MSREKYISSMNSSSCVRQMIGKIIIVVLAAASQAHARRPWFFNEISSEFVEQAMKYRSANVPQNEASSIAERIINVALSPPQVAQLGDEISAAFIEYGTNIPPSAALTIVNQAVQAYDQIRTSEGFHNYLEYISVNAKRFNARALEERPGNSNIEAVLRKELARLQEYAEGREAINSARMLASVIARDAGLPLGSAEATGRPQGGQAGPRQGPQQPGPRPQQPGPRPQQPGPRPQQPVPRPQQPGPRPPQSNPYEQPRPGYQPGPPVQPEPYQPYPEPPARNEPNRIL